MTVWPIYRGLHTSGCTSTRFADVIWHHMESIGTKAYTVSELRRMFSGYSHVEAKPILTPYDKSHWPASLSACFPNRWGWFIAIRAIK